ncbi:glycosyltransferase [Aestuariibius sp. HNIBRBA575]|uniref:glycosyltransferase n=1 Tax=Aestuariibius sp. HNIBRBA575 TaxID=3233343 RepID=UPI0034A2FBAC
MTQALIPELTIVIPTFNEKANIRPMVALLDDALQDVAWDVVFVDDDSPDGTAAEVRALGREDGRVRVLHRIGRRGLAGACIEGILSSVAPVCAVIDADLQHDETKLPEMLARLRDNPDLDIVIGSRNVEDGSAGTGLTSVRKWGSDQATTLAQRMLRITASDPMSGFFMVRRTSFNQVVLELQSAGFKILADMLSAARGRWNVSEIGYTFRERQHGESKMDAAVTLEFLGLLLARITGGVLSIRFILFGMVGVSGIFVQLIMVKLMLMLGFGFSVAQTLGVFSAMTTNFLANNLLTYRDRSLKGPEFLRGLLSFYAVCAIGALANVGVATITYTAIPAWAFASAVGAIVGALWNFVASSRVTWKSR